MAEALDGNLITGSYEHIDMPHRLSSDEPTCHLAKSNQACCNLLHVTLLPPSPLFTAVGKLKVFWREGAGGDGGAGAVPDAADDGDDDDDIGRVWRPLLLVVLKTTPWHFGKIEASKCIFVWGWSRP